VKDSVETCVPSPVNLAKVRYLHIVTLASLILRYSQLLTLSRIAQLFSKFTMFGPISFRRILLSRILLLSVPVLLTGQYVTYRKTRSTLLDTARYNLMQSAEHKRDRFHDFFLSIHASLTAISDSTALRSSDEQISRNFLRQFAATLPSNVNCLWLESIETGQVIAQTCDRIPADLPQTMWQPDTGTNPAANPAANPAIAQPTPPTNQPGLPPMLKPTLSEQASILLSNAESGVEIELQTVFLLPMFADLASPPAQSEGNTPTTEPRSDVTSSTPTNTNNSPNEGTNNLKNTHNTTNHNATDNPSSHNAIDASSYAARETALVFSTPIYASGVTQTRLTNSAVKSGAIEGKTASNSPRYVLRLVASLPIDNIERSNVEAAIQNLGYGSTSSVTSQTFIINKNGIILAHPFLGYVGQSIRNLPNAHLLEATLTNIDQSQEPSSIFTLDFRGQKVIAGQSVFYVPSSLNQDSAWVIMSVSDLDSVLANLMSIQQVMLNLVLLLLAANLIATLYLARDLARPVERLGRYAHSIELNSMPEPLPDHFAIHEFNQLSKTLKSTIERLKAWASEFEVAWKEARTANQLKSEFLTTISHELRTPLNGIIGSIRIIRDGLCDDRKEELDFLQRADDSAVHLLEIVNDILDISKIESGTLSVQFEQANLHQEIDEVLAFFHHDLEEKSLELILKPAASPLFVYTDPSKLRRVLLNVIGNAIKFTEVGQVEIMTRTEVDALKIDEKSDLKESSLYAVVEVRDTGIGIEPQDLQKVFQPFVMVDGSRTRKFGGTGLGLAISHNLMGMMDGSIAISSPGSDCGTTVTIHIPLAASSLKLRQMRGQGEADRGMDVNEMANETEHETKISTTESPEVRSS